MKNTYPIFHIFRTPAAWLYAAFAAELLLIIFLRNETGHLISPILIVGSGCFLAVFPVLLEKKNKGYLIKEEQNEAAGNIPYPWVLTLMLATIYAAWSGWIFYKNPLNINNSDILPFIKEVYLVRLQQGIPVYSSFTGFNYGTFTPSYLPAHWAPFIIPYLLHIDFRWICVAVFIGANLVFGKYVWKRDQTVSGRVKMVLPYLLVFSIYIKQVRDAAHTIEIMVVGYYLLLGISIFSRQAFNKAGGVLLPLLSRYSFLFWLPVYAITLFVSNKKIFFRTAAWGTLLLAVIFLPFIIQTPEMYKDFNGNYLSGVINEWQGQPWQKPGAKPFQLFQGMGFASWFYEFYSGDLPAKIVAIRTTLLWVSAGLMVSLTVIFFRLKNTIGQSLFALLSLKLSLTFFYAFIMVPYIYLNWVPLIISVLIISRINPSAKHSES
jgi:hypothetical protein